MGGKIKPWTSDTRYEIGDLVGPSNSAIPNYGSGVLRLFARQLLEISRDHPVSGWSLQGLGMFRLYLSPEYRLHVWDDRFRIPNVSQIHTHTWDLESEVLAGGLTDHVYSVYPRDQANGGEPYLRRLLVTGTGGCLVDDDPPTPVVLIEQRPVPCPRGAVYRRRYDEVHRTEVGCAVTLTRRTVRVKDDRAYVFWPLGEEWVSAEPRVATPDEVRSACVRALKELDWR